MVGGDAEAGTERFCRRLGHFPRRGVEDGGAPRWRRRIRARADIACAIRSCAVTLTSGRESALSRVDLFHVQGNVL